MKVKIIFNSFFYLLLFIITTAIHGQINTEKFRQDADTIGFTGNADIDATAITGNTDFQLLSIGGKVNYNWGNDYTFLVLDAGFGWKDGESFSDNSLFHLRHVLSLSELMQLEFFTQYDFNKDRLLLDRELAGAGVRFKVFTNDYLKFRYGLACMFEHEVYDLPANSVHDHKTSISRMSSYVTFELKLQENLSFGSVTYYQPNVIALNDYRLISENSLTVILGSLVDLNIKFNMRFDSHPPDLVKRFDTVSKFGLLFKF